jgi:hypothetical protein
MPLSPGAVLGLNDGIANPAMEWESSFMKISRIARIGIKALSAIVTASLGVSSFLCAKRCTPLRG